MSIAQIKILWIVNVIRKILFIGIKKLLKEMEKYMIDLSTNPFNLNDEQIQKVTKICSDMTLDEKIGQIFCPIGNVQDEKK